jgi:hypothetical protein
MGGLTKVKQRAGDNVTSIYNTSNIVLSVVSCLFGRVALYRGDKTLTRMAETPKQR